MIPTVAMLLQAGVSVDAQVTSVTCNESMHLWIITFVQKYME